MKIALLGNPNSGKTTLFNLLTGLKQKVGNWPGVTVEKKQGVYTKDKSVEIVDLPGVYSLNPVSLDEKVTRDFLATESVDCVVNIVDSANLSRSLMLSLQALDEMCVPMVIALNMEDELAAHGLSIEVGEVSKCIAPAVKISAKKKRNIDALMSLVREVASNPPRKQIVFAGESVPGQEQAVGTTLVEIVDKGKGNGENLSVLRERTKREASAEDKEQPITLQQRVDADVLGEEGVKERASVLPQGEEGQVQTKTYVYKKFVDEHLDRFVKKGVSKIQRLTDKIDKIVLNKFLAFPIFLGVIVLMYFVSVQVVGGVFSDWLEGVVSGVVSEGVRSGLVDIGSPRWVVSLVVEGVISGVGSVLLFAPQIIVLFAFITFLEGCGYMSRVAIIMDRLFVKLGLSGKSFIPMLLGCGCSVTAILTAKTVEDEWQRKRTIMLVPFVPCSAKLPVFALIAGALYPGNPLVAPSMYFLGIGMAILGGLVLKRFGKQKEDTFVLELPHYRLPSVRSMLLDSFQKAKGFVVKAAVVILPMTIVLWFLSNFGFDFAMVSIEDSMLASIGRVVSVLFVPLGFGTWQSAVALMTGFLAKETVVATFGVLYGEVGLSATLATAFTPWGGYAFMAFVLLSAPCVSAIVATKKEMGGVKWMLLAMGFQTLVGYLVALVIFQVGNLWAWHRAVAISILAVGMIVLVFGWTIKRWIGNQKRGGGCIGCSGCSKASQCDKKWATQKDCEHK
ncbi:MAG: ferrous iron transport protein B [Firmicutes bacterium]|nr:ferrous iron transport protein B [Bacillota bacterium]